MEIGTIAIVLAAGQGKRMNSKVRKQYLLLQDRPVLYYSLRALQESAVDDIILVAGKEDIPYVRREIVERYGFTKVRSVVEGGRERYHSVFRGLQEAERLLFPTEPFRKEPFRKESCRKGSDPAVGVRAGELSAASVPEEHYCLIHDGARPFLTLEILDRVMESVRQDRACVAGMPAKDTVKLADKDGFTASTPPRSSVWMIQTPQAFSFELICRAYAELMEREEELTAQGIQITDDAGVVELLTDSRVKLVEGSYENIKITTPEDLRIAESFLAHV